METAIQTLSGEPFTRGNRFELLVDGPEFYPARLEMIRNARHTIDLTTFLWCDDESGLAVAEALASAARERNVRVRVIVDWANDKPHARGYQTMRDAGVEMLIFNPLSWGVLNALKRMHQKTMIVDGTELLLGGANLCDEYMVPHAARGLWRDLELRVRGPQVSRVQARIDATWNWMAQEDNANRIQEGAPLLRRYEEPTPVPRHPEAGTARGIFLYQQPRIRPEDEARHIELYRQLLLSARERIILYDAYLIPPRDLEEALKDRARKGVSVDIITNSLKSNDMGQVFVSSSLSHFGRLMRAGVRIWEAKERTYHAKGFLIDRSALSVGSHNFTNHSHRNNGESNLLTDQPEAIDRFERMFAEDTAGDELHLITPQDLIARSNALDEQGFLILGTWLTPFF
ncbi:MAG: phosphatidylserine/phosphatidylglycerophosphate/cardiolipin synthase family protein [Bdellovibrionales bacterium]|nr:phosphatidylserine/phosphatidylglycerophosphate/cardiolipin synthase family protein [Bdellovibrionales bacterium]